MVEEPMRPSKSFEIRGMEKADAPVVVELIGKTMSPRDAEFAKSIFTSYFQLGDESLALGEFYVATLSGRVVGVSGYYRRRNSYWLGWFAVSPEFQGLGVGSALLEKVEGAVRAKGAKELFVYTSRLPQFKRAREFYRRKGFEEVNEADHPRWEEDMVFLCKRL
jgi:GNAT superfamily N-acetyltransferase